MVADLNMNVTVVGCPIVREADGLAKSSRNAYLSAEERQAALVLSRAVFAGKEAVEAGERDAAVLKALMSGIIEAEPLARIDYVGSRRRGDHAADRRHRRHGAYSHGRLHREHAPHRQLHLRGRELAPCC